MANAVTPSGAYSFLDVNVAITGPGIQANLSDPGFSGEGIKVSMIEEKDTLVVGAGGDGMHSMRASKAARATISLLKTGPGNALLSQAYNYQATSAAYWGQNIVTITNPVSGDVVTLQGGAFVKQPEIVNATEANVMEWEFNFTQCDMLLGNGYQATGI